MHSLVICFLTSASEKRKKFLGVLPSELHAQGDLQVALAAANVTTFCSYFAEIRSGRVEVHAATASAAPVRVVKHVEGFGTELKAHTFVNGNACAYAKVTLLEPRQT